MQSVLPPLSPRLAAYLLTATTTFFTGEQKTQIHIDQATGVYFELDSTAAAATTGTTAGVEPQRKKLKKAEISLNDCLACSYVDPIPLYLFETALRDKLDLPC